VLKFLPVIKMLHGEFPINSLRLLLFDEMGFGQFVV
jgi:hypothetical protein